MISTGDTAFILLCTALVAIMTPGVAFFYGGLVRRKNSLTLVLQSFIAMGVVTVLWVTIGYSLVFSSGKGGFIGNLDWFALRGVGQAPGPWAAHIPALAHFAYLLMFAVITPTLITGAFADRVRFASYLVFLTAWSILVYLPLAHMTWGGGFLAAHGVPAASSSTSPAASPPSPRSSSSAAATMPRARSTDRTASPSPPSAPPSSGSAGSASTPARRSPPTASRRRPSSPRRWRLRWRCAPGSRLLGFGTGARP